MDNFLTGKKFWKKRAVNYDRLQWTTREGYLQAFIGMCGIRRGDTVLDLGTGTGTVARALHREVREVVGVDFSREMIVQAQKKNSAHNIRYLQGDIRSLPFPNDSFDLVTARMVFHHVLWGTGRALSEIRRVVKPGGRFCLSEGVPPDRCVETFYKAVFKLKEKRRTFFSKDLRLLMENGGFRDIAMRTYLMRRCSIKNWLDNAGDLSDDSKKTIYQMHLDLHPKGKKAYTMEITDGDCFIDMQFIIISGRKKRV